MEQRISIERLEQAINLFGSFDENIRLIESEFHVTVANREGELRVNGEPEDTMLACKALSALFDALQPRRGHQASRTSAMSSDWPARDRRRRSAS